jgi:hypothetical protein
VIIDQIISSGKPGTFLGVADAAARMRIQFDRNLDPPEAVIRSTDAALILTDGPPDDFQCEVQHTANLQDKPCLRIDIKAMPDNEIVMTIVLWRRANKPRSLFIDGPVPDDQADRVSLLLRAGLVD